LYSLTLSKNKVISEVGQWRITDNVESFQWKLVIMEAELCKCEKELQEQLPLILNTAQWKRNESNDWIWGKEEGNSYTVSSG